MNIDESSLRSKLLHACPPKAATSSNSNPTSHKKKVLRNLHLRRPMFETTCTLPLSSELFAQAVHPDEPLLAIGLSSGHVSTLRLPPVDSSVPRAVGQKKRRDSNGRDVVDTAWRTKRHKGSCRALAYNHDGTLCYSAGTDGIIKCFESATGRVVSKVAVEGDGGKEYDTDHDAPCVVFALSPQGLLVGLDNKCFIERR